MDPEHKMQESTAFHDAAVSDTRAKITIKHGILL
jgi:hypothetical protein